MQPLEGSEILLSRATAYEYFLESVQEADSEADSGDANQIPPCAIHQLIFPPGFKKMLSIIPADQVLVVAIKDATKSNSTVNPARITTAVQKMRPDWSVNKRRVKRLLRTMNNDAWKAAVSPVLPSGEATSAPTEADGAAPPPAETSSRGSTSTSTSNSNRATARGAAKAAARKAAAREAAAGKSDAASAAGDVCDTAPASPGSPATSTAVAVTASLATAQTKPVASAASSSSADSKHPAAATAIDVPQQRRKQQQQQQQSRSCSSGTAAAPWNEAKSAGGIAADSTLNATGGEGDEEPLSDSLRLEPDLELEPGVDLKADLGLGEAAPGFEQSEAGKGAGMEEDEPLVDGGGDVTTTTARIDDLGFEMIDRAEAVAAEVGAESATGGRSASSVAGKGRKGWPWAWGRN